MEKLSKTMTNEEKNTSNDEIKYAQVDDKNNKQPELSLEDAILSRLTNSSAVFKSQQKDEPELSAEEKRKIATDLLYKNHAEFLSRFGKYLNTNLLEYFLLVDKDDYEVIYHVNRLKRYFNNNTRAIDKKNRRYEALKVLIDKGEYFSEIAMMNRNPLLYDNLIGQYLTEDQKKERDSVYEKEDTLVNRLMKRIDRDEADELKKKQQDDENDVMEENDSDSENDKDRNVESNDIRQFGESSKSLDERKKATVQWGELSKSTEETNDEANKSYKILTRIFISSKEQKILRDEFVTHMYQSFLDGKDTDFDYSTVDDNEAYDNFDIRTHDEEDKYFDSESPECVTSPSAQNKIQDDESEDELDKYMNALKEQTHNDDDHPRKSSS